MSENVQTRRFRQPRDVGIARPLDCFGSDHDHLDDLLKVRAAVQRLMEEMIQERGWPADDRRVAGDQNQFAHSSRDTWSESCTHPRLQLPALVSLALCEPVPDRVEFR